MSHLREEVQQTCQLKSASETSREKTCIHLNFVMEFENTYVRQRPGSFLPRGHNTPVDISSCDRIQQQKRDSKIENVWKYIVNLIYKDLHFMITGTLNKRSRNINVGFFPKSWPYAYLTYLQ